MRRTLAAATILYAALYAQISVAETQTYRSEYNISALGLPIGVTRFETTISPDRYTLTGTLYMSFVDRQRRDLGESATEALRQ